MTDLSCRNAVELVNAVVDGELHGQEERLVIAHLRTCTGCRRYVAQVELVVNALADLAGEPLPSEIRNGLLATYRTHVRRRSRARPGQMSGATDRSTHSRH